MYSEPSRTLLKVSWELGKLKGLVKSLKVVISKPEIERNLLRTELQEILMSLESLRTYLKHYIDEVQMDSFINFMASASQAQQQKVQLSLQDLLKLLSTPKIPENEIESLFSTLNATLMLLDYAKDLPDGYFKEKVGGIISKLSSLLASIESSLGISLHEAVKISELLGIVDRWGMSERWAVAACYLTALEIVVNKKLKELGIESSDKFKEKFRQLVKALSEKGVDVGELEKKLPEVFWELRNKVIHEGYEPKEDELNTIVEWTMKIIETFYMR